jgi:hypothetical protein
VAQRAEMIRMMAPRRSSIHDEQEARSGRRSDDDEPVNVTGLWLVERMRIVEDVGCPFEAHAMFAKVRGGFRVVPLEIAKVDG